jgi:hypothetical protein
MFQKAFSKRGPLQRYSIQNLRHTTVQPELKISQNPFPKFEFSMLAYSGHKPYED